MTTRRVHEWGVVRGHPCPYCGSAADEPCRDSEGRETAYPHKDRLQVAER